MSAPKRALPKFFSNFPISLDGSDAILGIGLRWLDKSRVAYLFLDFLTCRGREIANENRYAS